MRLYPGTNELWFMVDLSPSKQEAGEEMPPPLKLERSKPPVMQPETGQGCKIE